MGRTVEPLTVTRQQARLYHALLREVIGPYWRSIHDALGPASAELYVAIRHRHGARATQTNGERVELDDIDMAAIRILAPIVSRVIPERDFTILTGHRPGELRKLRELAEGRRREFGHRGGFVSMKIGNCQIKLPTTPLATNVSLVGVPDEASWDRLMPRCARRHRAEYLSAMKDHFEGRGEWRWEERAVSSLEELQLLVSGRRLELMPQDPAPDH